MSVLQPLRRGAAVAGYEIPFGAIFESTESTRLWQSWSSAPTSGTTFTVSTWARRLQFAANQLMHYGGDPAGASFEQWRFNTDNSFRVAQASNAYVLETEALWRDPTDWYHVVVVFDTTNATDTERIRIYVNGVRITNFSSATWPAQNFVSNMVSDQEAGNERVIGANSNTGPASQFYSGALAEIVQVDGQALEPTEFGELDGNYWTPKRYSGATGANGFRLDFADSANFGKDVSKGTQVPQGDGTLIGNMTSDGGLAAAFDGVRDQVSANCARTSGGTTGEIGKTWASAKTVTSARVYGSNNFGFGSGASTITLRLEGSNDAFATAGVQLASRGPFDDPDGTFPYNLNAVSPAAYTSHRVVIEASLGTAQVAEVEFYEGGNAPNSFVDINMVPALQVTDTPTNRFGNLSIIDSAVSLRRNGYRDIGAGSSAIVHGPIIPTSGQWGWKIDVVTVNSGSGTAHTWGICDQGVRPYQNAAAHNSVGTYVQPSGNVFRDAVQVGTVPSFGNGDTIFITYDADAATCTFQINATAPFTVTGVPVREYMVYGQDAGVCQMDYDFGQSGYDPSPALPLTKPNYPVSAISDSSKGFSAAVRAGTGAAASVTAPNDVVDFPWIKKLTGLDSHRLVDTKRGATLEVYSDLSSSEATELQGVTAFDADGYDLGTSTAYNQSSQDFVDFRWTANPLYGFEVSIRDGDGVAGRAVPHGLGIAPSMIIVKNRDTSQNWPVWLEPVSSGNIVTLNNSDTAFADNAFNGASEDINAATFSVGNDPKTNSNGARYVDYLFASVPGFSRVGVYNANASTDGPFQYCGFKPAFWIGFTIGGTGAGRWMIDSIRSPDNPRGKETRAVVQANSTAAGFGGASYHIDFLSTGFKIRTSSDFNSSGRTIAWYCAAEAPQERARAA